MIGRLTGRVVDSEADGTVVLEAGGVGYEVLMPLGALGRLGAPGGAGGSDAPVTVHVHTHVREDAFLLYGFVTREDRTAFRALIGVSSIGPKIALAILGALEAAELARVVTRGETARLTAISGVGKKTAERIVLELRDKLPALSLGEAVAARRPAPRSSGPGGEKRELLHGALTRLGFRAAEADRAVEGLGDRLEEAPVGDLVREALALLAK